MSTGCLFSSRFVRSMIERFALLTILKLALGMAATAATVGVTNAALPGWLPGQHLEPLFFLQLAAGPPAGAASTGGEATSFSLPAFEALRGNHRAFSDVMAFAPLGHDRVTVQAGGLSDQATGEMVSGNFFSGLRVKMRLGGGFKMEDEHRHTPLVVLSFAYWTHLYSRDPDVAGRVIYIEGVPFAVLGVAGEGFSGAEPDRLTDFWIPLQSRPELKPWGSSQTLYGSPNWWCLRLIARPAPGVDAQRAVAEATPEFRTAAYAGLSAPGTDDLRVRLLLVPAEGIQGLRHGYPAAALVLMALATLLLLTACGYGAMRIMARNATPKTPPSASGGAAS